MNRAGPRKRILIVRMDRIGDVVLSTPAIKAVRDEYPDSYIAVLVRPYARGIMDGNPYVNEVITYDKSGGEKGIFGNIRFISHLRRKRFDLAIILHPKNSSHVLTFLAGIPERIGYDKKLGVLLTKRISHTKQYGLKHEMDYTLDLLSYIGIKPKDKNLYMPLNKLSVEKIRAIFNKNGIFEKDIIVTIHPAASCPSRRWSLDRFAETADILSEKFKARLIIVAGRE
ncbi:MAG: glycosyltransferase family 9 protein, partial [Candidatus Omnitrophota bacterium]|nr:glycosyltransferase family 9 protein [Candidatus Omnitrophota bacterium]